MNTHLSLDPTEGRRLLAKASRLLQAWKQLDPNRLADAPDAALRESFGRARDLAASPWLEIRADLLPELPEWIQKNYSDASIPLQDALAELADALHEVRLSIATHYGRKSDEYSELLKLFRKEPEPRSRALRTVDLTGTGQS